jgi:hypothetical protein
MTLVSLGGKDNSIRVRAWQHATICHHTSNFGKEGKFVKASSFQGYFAKNSQKREGNPHHVSKCLEFRSTVAEVSRAPSSSCPRKHASPGDSSRFPIVLDTFSLKPESASSGLVNFGGPCRLQSEPADCHLPLPPFSGSSCLSAAPAVFHGPP